MHRFAKDLNSSASPMKELRRKANESDPEQALWKRLSKKPLGEMAVQYASIFTSRRKDARGRPRSWASMR